MKVYVVMGNDFPEAVFSGKETADQFCEAMRGKNRNQYGVRANIYWRSYEFEMDEHFGEGFG